jgi:hypothetical protein
MATEVMGEEEGGHTSGRKRPARAQPARVFDTGSAARRAQHGPSRVGNVREVVREAVFATFDALRGRYDR